MQPFTKLGLVPIRRFEFGAKGHPGSKLGLGHLATETLSLSLSLPTLSLSLSLSVDRAVNGYMFRIREG